MSKEFALVHDTQKKVYYLAMADSIKSTEGLDVVQKFPSPKQALEALVKHSEKEPKMLKAENKKKIIKRIIEQVVEAMPGPGQAPLGGVDPGDEEVLVKGYGRIKRSQAFKQAESILEAMPVHLNHLQSPHQAPGYDSKSRLKKDAQMLVSLIDALVGEKKNV